MHTAQRISPPSSSHPVGMIASSPIPRQWWEQGPQAAHQQTHNADGTVRSVTPAMSNKVGQLGVVSAPKSRVPIPPGGGPNAGQGAAANIDRGYYRPSAPSPKPALQQPLTNGIHDNKNLAPSYSQHGASPSNAAFSSMNGSAGMPKASTALPPSSDSNVPPRVPSATGLIRLTLKKPMGIVFEPMTDPHNSSQQRGVRICDLPRTGAAALSRKVEVGDELLSINDKTMSRLTFDEIMDFIIESDPDQVNLLFRRPRKEQLKSDGPSVGVGTASAGTGTGMSVNLNENVVAAALTSTPAASNGNTVKWVDGKDGSGPKKTSTREEKKKGKGAGGKKKKPVKDEESIATGDSSRFTSETPREKGRAAKKGREPYSSESFLDMLMDSICAPLVPKDVKRRRAAAHEEEYSDDDMTFNSADDSTYVTNDSGSLQNTNVKGGKNAYNKPTAKVASKGQGKKQEDDTIDYEFADDDRTQGTIESMKEAIKKKSSKKKEAPASKEKEEQKPKKKKDKTNSSSSVSSSTQPSQSKFIQPATNLKDNTKKKVSTKYDEVEVPDEEEGPPEGNYEDDATLETVETQERAKIDVTSSPESPPPLGLAPQNPARKMSIPVYGLIKKNQIKESDMSSYIPDSNIPISELEYDKQLDQGDVSVLESLGGPSLLIENHRLSQAVAAGNAAARYSPTPSVSAELISSYGNGFPADTGFTQDETIRRDPIKFYRHVVRELLYKNEPEKVRLLDKLLAKYKRREEHLIQKLSVRYTREKDKARNSQFEQSGGSDNAKQNNDSFEAFGVFPKVTSRDGTKHVFENGTWPPIGDDNINNDARKEATGDDDFSQGTHSSYTESEYSGDSIDGTSPAVIAQVSELLNYVYGKTSVPGQIDRVSTIMRAYEGREAVLLELLETKALIKANADNEQSTKLPVSLRSNHAFEGRSPGEHQDVEQFASPMSGLTTYSKDEIPLQEMTDDVSTISGADDFNVKSAPVHSAVTPDTKSTKNTASASILPFDSSDKPKENQKVNLSVNQLQLTDTATTFDKKKKKGIFGGIFGGKKRNKAAGSFPNSDGTIPGKGKSKILSPKGKKGVLLNSVESEGSG